MRFPAHGEADMKVLAFGGLFCWAVAIGSWTLPAKADWQYTRWGMTKEEVVSASRSTVFAVTKSEKGNASERQYLLASSYNTAGFSFQVQFFFNKQERLDLITLNLVPLKECESLRLKLTDIYGPPAVTNTEWVGPVSKWWDKPNANVVTLLDSKTISLCQVMYEPYSQPGQKGGL